MRKKDQNKKKKTHESKLKLSKSKKRIFWGITILIPFFILFLTEVSLRVFNYGGDLDLFIDGPDGYEEYKRCNPNAARRYFSGEESVPTPPIQLFKKNKAENGLRIFVLGGSSSAGFPYSNNLSFPNLLQSKLSMLLPDKEVEVINIAMSAINSYSLVDMIDEVLVESPNAILIYAGHNEFYGALGVGSVQSIGTWRGLVRTYLKLHKIKIFLAIKDFVVWGYNFLGSTSTDTSDPTNTLMARIVGKQTIGLNSELYSNGKQQFSENMKMVIDKVKSENIPIIISELVSNLKDQQPFISISDNSEKNAESYFKMGIEATKTGEYESAKKFYTLAKDHDALRFRASEEFNIVLRELAENNNIPIVPLVSYFEQASEYEIMGNNLFWEHLHPNKEGYNILANAFFKSLQKNNIIKQNNDSLKITNLEHIAKFTELDSVYAALVIRHLKSGWPFKKQSAKNNFYNTFKAKTKVEEIALKVMKKKNYNLESGHLELGNYYEDKNNLDKALKEFFALISSIPHEIEFYEKVATILIKQKKYSDAAKILHKSNSIKTNNFAQKWIGQIALINKNYQDTIEYLLLADLNDSQVLFNLSRAYYHSNRKVEGDKYFKKLAQQDSKSQYLPYLSQMRKKMK